VSIFAMLGLLLASLALVFVLYPVLKPTPDSEVTRDDAELAERRRALYRQILEIEFDQRLGKLDETDARELSERLLSQAAELMASESSAEHEIEARVESEIQAARRALAAGESEAAASLAQRVT
jgi:hypothetical protein